MPKRKIKENIFPIKMTYEKFFKCFGAIFIAVVVFRLVNTYLFVQGAAVAKGSVFSHKLEIVRESSQSHAKWKTIYCPVVKFSDKKGNEITFESEFCDKKGVFSEGTVVEVYYYPGLPAEAKIKSFKHLWGGNIGIVCFALFFCFCLGPIFRVFKNIKSP